MLSSLGKSVTLKIIWLDILSESIKVFTCITTLRITLKAYVSHSSLKLNPSKIHLFIHSHSNNTKLRQLFPYVLRNLKTKEIMKIWVKTIVETENALKKVFLLTNQNLQVFILNFFNITRIESTSEVRHCDFKLRITHQNKANWM